MIIIVFWFDTSTRVPKDLCGLCCQKQVITSHNKQRDVITYPCLRYLPLATKSSYVKWTVPNYNKTQQNTAKHGLWYQSLYWLLPKVNTPDSKVHGANMGPIWGRQDQVGPLVGPIYFAVWASMLQDEINPICFMMQCKFRALQATINRKRLKRVIEWLVLMVHRVGRQPQGRTRYYLVLLLPSVIVTSH